ncbi:hypothetical protein [Streptomyces sp. NPDC002851]
MTKRLTAGLAATGVAATLLVALPATEAYAGEQCKIKVVPGWEKVINTSNSMTVAYRTFVKNQTGKTQSYKFTSKRSKTSSFKVEATISASMKAWVFAEVKGEINSGIEKSWTSEIGIEAYGKVKPHHTMYGNYGIMRENFKLRQKVRYSNCKEGYVYRPGRAPYREGWKTWTRKN